MKRTEPRSITSIINEVMADAGLTSTFNEQKACHAWPDVVGPIIDRHTSRRYVNHGILHVYLTSSALKQELTFHRDTIISRLNDIVGARVILDIRFH